MRALALVVLTACGGANAAPVGPAHPAPSTVADAGPSTAATDTLPTLADLAARAPEVAPGMRELARGESTHADLLHAATVDTCVRLVFAATSAVSVHLESSNGAPLASIESSLGGVLASRGPVCVRRGDGARVSFDGATTTRVRWVAWGAP